ncbi:MAG: SMC-Scp complex subunit ScpB [Anaerolineae bacterium CG_4_9_14_3_um_filter_57_17]|nr:SMC-Scp complex subunit ScpB [bacterium]NCT20997.1 SMC-Scp complex subunit ScpB [bacterium]OIO85123.1 MAG: SMC-Scp complex subunit ScpB [Anaerolineae bacterium CG2_30_57_67]PJB66164.1 MAG: SMC-Scp complex subunit ScpB [Anaerolineae bacterium CG_4_9_14_3_um_filter_57_17]
MSEEAQNLPEASLAALLEGLLFAASEALTPAQLAAALEMNVSEVEKGLADLEQDLRGRGICLQRHLGRVQLTSAPEIAEVIERLLGLEATSRLSRAALEALAIIAYQQPVTRPQVDAIRGVNSDGVMKSLLSKGLLQEVGRSEGAGRPILYGTTPDFLQHFGLSSLTELPLLDLEKVAVQDAGLLKS